MRLLTAVTAATLLILAPVSAIFADEAYKLDYHHALIGYPLANSTFFAQPYADSKASLIYSLSEKGVFAAVNPKDGNLVWRQQLAANLTSATALDKIVRAGDGQDLLYAAVGGELSAWSPADGRLAWRKAFAAEESIKDIRVIQAVPAQQGIQDVAVLTAREDSAGTVSRLDGNTGTEKWAYKDASGDIPYGLAASASEFYYISISKALLKGYKIKVTVLDSADGNSKETISLGSESDIQDPARDILFLGLPASPIIAWTDPTLSSLKLNVLGSKNTASFDVKSKAGAVKSISIQAPGKPSVDPHFLASYQGSDDHWADVFHVNTEKKSVSKAYETDKLGGSGVYSASSVGSQVYFTRVTPFESSIVASNAGKYLARFLMPPNLGVSGISDAEIPAIRHAASEVVVRADGSYALRSAALLTTGDWVLIKNDVVEWARPESLAAIIEATFGEFQAVEPDARNILIEEDLSVVSAFIHRFARHIKSIQSLPDLWQQLPDLATSWAQALFSSGSSDRLKEAAFGFDKLAVVLTEDHRVIALDASNGRVAWNRHATCPGSLLDKVMCAGDDSGIPKTKDSSRPEIALKAQKVAALDEAIAQKETVLLSPHQTAYAPSKGGLRGYTKSASGEPEVPDLWFFTPLPGQAIQSVVARVHEEPVASIGKALVDRSVLYKYLNPNAILITAVDHAANAASFYLLDAVSGTELTAFHHSNVDTTRPITSLLSENWLTYSFTSDPTGTDAPAGSQLVVAELYESSLPNDRGPLGTNDTFSTIDPAVSSVPALPYAFSQAFVIPDEITSMSATQTGQGITSRHLLVTLASHALVSIPRQVLDPRRPVGKAPSQAQAVEEGLTQYQPVIDLNPQWYLSHARDVALDHVIASPSGMESTSLVFAWGLDVFGTRVAPSFLFDILGSNFNKIQLVLTVIGLFIGTVAVAPVVGRKGVNGLWNAPT